jgi:hypothetical protein
MHKTLRVTPAMETGTTSLADLLTGNRSRSGGMIDGRMATLKSPARARYERETKGLLKQYRPGKIECAEFSHRVLAALNHTAPLMTEGELLETQRWLFETMSNVTDVLAKWGHPAPGNDPKRPN